MSNFQQTDWRVLLCDRMGVPISNVSAIATGKKIVETLNAPTSFAFNVPSDDPRVATLYTDGAPYLDYLRRTVKAYRREPQPDGSWRWVIRFAGHVWPVQDNGTDTQLQTSVTCYDPLQMMAYKLCRNAAGSFANVVFTSVELAQILKQLVDNTNSNAGPSGLTTGTSDGDFTGLFPILGVQSVQWQYNLISSALQEILPGLDLSVTPLDRTDGYLGGLSTYKLRGVLQSNAIFAWKTTPNNLASATRFLDPSNAANVLIGIGQTASNSDQMIAVAADARNSTVFGQLEAVASYSSITDQAHLNNQVAADLYSREPLGEAVAVGQTLADRGPRPWLDFNTGDWVIVNIDPSLRGGVLQEQQRAYGFSLDISDDGEETVQLVTTPPNSTAGSYSPIQPPTPSS